MRRTLPYRPESRAPPFGATVFRFIFWSIWKVVETAAESTGMPTFFSTTGIASSEGI